MNITLTELFEPFTKIMRRYLIQRELTSIKYHRSFIQNRRNNDFHVERMLDKREVVLRSKLHGL